MKLPIEYKECPDCHCEETVCRIACADEPLIPKDTFVAMERTFTPLQEPSKLLGPLVKGILVSWDVCAQCGRRRCVKAEIINAPVTVQQVGLNPHSFRKR